MPNESFEQFELLPSEGDLLTIANSDAAASIECDASCVAGGSSIVATRVGDGADTGQKNLQNEWFDEIIVRTQIEGTQNLRNRVDCR